VFAACAIAGGVYGAAVRSRAGLSDLVPRWSAPTDGSAVVTSEGSVDDDLRLTLLEGKLELLGVPPAGRRRIVGKAIKEVVGPLGPDLLGDIVLLQTKTETALGAISAVVKPEEVFDDSDGGDEVEDGPPPLTKTLVSELQTVALLCKQWATPGSDGKHSYVARESLVALLDGLSSTVIGFHGERVARRPKPLNSMGLYEWAAANLPSLDLRPLIELERFVGYLDRKYASTSWIGRDDSVADAIDGLIDKRKASIVPSERRQSLHIAP
jgi:hypothetical protein